jgi:hypothetical protein
MGFSPTLLELPNGSVVAVNGRHSFFIRDGCKASEVRLSSRDCDLRVLPPIYQGSEKIVYFVADPHPGTAF